MESIFDETKSNMSTTTNPWLKNYLTRKLETIEENYDEEDDNSISTEQHNRKPKKEKNCKPRKKSFDSVSVSTKAEDIEEGQHNLKEVKNFIFDGQIIDKKSFICDISLIKLKLGLQNPNAKINSIEINNDTIESSSIASNSSHESSDKNHENTNCSPDKLKSGVNNKLDSAKLDRLKSKIKKLIFQYKNKFKDDYYKSADDYYKALSEKIKTIKKEIYSGNIKIDISINDEAYEFIAHKLTFSKLSSENAKFLICKINILECAYKIISLVNGIESSTSQITDIATIKSYLTKMEKHIIDLENFKATYHNSYEKFKGREKKIKCDLAFEMEKLKNNLKYLSSCIETVIDAISGKIVPYHIESDYRYKHLIDRILDYNKLENGKKNAVMPRTSCDQPGKNRHQNDF